jgi:acyl-CoA reductase-like NAD-dependent aldehyde dehydrogenase
MKRVHSSRRQELTSEVVRQPEMSGNVRSFLARSHGHLIDGVSTGSSSGGTFETLDPSSGQILATVSRGDIADVDAAVRAARQALSGNWARISPIERGSILSRLADLLASNADELAELESLDNGKPVQFARGVDLALSIDHFRYFAGWPSKIVGEVVPVSTPGAFCYTLKEPVGVCAQIIPWNYPLLMAAWKVAPALAAGCTIVLKPAEETPLTALRLGELALEAGLPPGVLNIVTGDGATGAMLVDHPDVDKVAFTGSTEVGREIGAKAGHALKRVTLELGGKSPNIILPDADLDVAVPGSFLALYFNSGQSCNAGSRLFVHRSRYDEVVEKVAALASSASVGPGLQSDVLIGPLVSARQQERVMSYIDAGRRDGADLVSGGARMPGAGYFVEPTVFATDRDDLSICQEEIFGPVLVASPYDSIDELAIRANDTEYGLAAGVWTRDLASAHKLAAALKAGSIYVNQWAPNDAAAPFGGYKSSGLGREHGRLGLESYLENKTVWIQVG